MLVFWGSIEKIDLPIYEHCLAGKATKLPFDKAKRATLPLQLIHSNIRDLIKIETALRML